MRKSQPPSKERESFWTHERLTAYHRLRARGIKNKTAVRMVRLGWGLT